MRHRLLGGGPRLGQTALDDADMMSAGERCLMITNAMISLTMAFLSPMRTAGPLGRSSAKGGTPKNWKSALLACGSNAFSQNTDGICSEFAFACLALTTINLYGSSGHNVQQARPRGDPCDESRPGPTDLVSCAGFMRKHRNGMCDMLWRSLSMGFRTWLATPRADADTGKVLAICSGANC